MSDAYAAAPPLAAVLLSTARSLHAVLGGRSLTDVLADVPEPQRPAVQALSFHVLRTLGRARALRQALVPRDPPSALLDALLLTALSLLDVATDTKTAVSAGAEGGETGAVPSAAAAAPAPSTDAAPAPSAEAPVIAARRGPPRYAPHTLVDQAVQAAASHPKLRPCKGLVNAVLRRFLREREALLAALPAHGEARWNTPDWWVQRLRKDYPEQWQALLAAADEPPALTLRVNRRRATREQVAQALREAGVDSVPVLEDGLVLAQARPVGQLPGFAEGWWSVQDAGAQQAAPLLQVRDGMRVLDACAAPGGKTAHLLEQAQLRLVALDEDAGRLGKVAQNLDRLGLAAAQVTMRAADAADLASWWDGEPFDAVLADVPCTASGIVRRHPDIRWLRRPDDLPRTAALQARIADALWQTVAPGGRLLYATCSIFPIECEQQASAFAARHADAERLPAPGQLLPSPAQAPLAERRDGFFYALFAKRA